MEAVRKRQIIGARRAARKGRPHRYRIILIVLLALFTLGSLTVVAGLGAVYAVYKSYADEYLPIETKLKLANIGLTDIYDRGGPDSGAFLGSLTNPDAQLLNPVPLDRISKWMVQATISTEDNTFETNPGINIQGLLRAAWENYVGGGIGSGTGGSSITQQLVKNVYICPQVQTGDSPVCANGPATEGRKGLDRKLREITYALELEKDYSKDQILQWYLNQISYADRYIGVEAAAQGYFHKPAADLDLAEAALLAGIPAYPTDYHPRYNCVRDESANCVVDNEGRTTVAEKAKERQEAVLDLMVIHGRATRAEADAAKAEVLKVYASSNPLKASAFIDDQVEPRLVRMCEAKLLPIIDGATDCKASVHAAGYKVTTTLDWAETDLAQQMIRGFINTGIENGCNCYNASIVTIDPTTGQVLIYAPNRDPSYVSDPRVAGNIDQAVEINQPGSSFKPVVYLTWFDRNRKNPMSTLWDTSPLTIEGTAITNPRPGGGGEGLITARAALGGSQNVGAFRAAYEAGVDNVIEMAKKMGITTLDQRFDPTFRAHQDVTYGASIATGGANIRVIDMAYMNSVIANMGLMVGVPTLARTVQLKDLKSTAVDTGVDYDTAVAQRIAFQHGDIRIPGTRELDPVVVLEVRDRDGNVLYKHGADLQKKQVVDGGSVWLVHSIIGDCRSRWIIWNCGGSNSDLALDPFLDGVRIPGGAKTGTQQGPKSAVDTLATWMNGYSRYAAVGLWVGNSNKELVRDGPQANYAAANTTVRLFKNWMSEYHAYLRRQGVIGATLEGFDAIRPKNVAERSVQSPTTERGMSGGCDQTVTSWVRTDVSYDSECEEREIDTRNGLLASEQTPAQFRATKKFVKLPGLKPDLAKELAKEKNIPIAPTERSAGQSALEIGSLSNGKTITGNTPVVGSVNTTGLKSWKLEIGAGASPTEWKTIGSGTSTISNGVLGEIDVKDLPNGVYTVRLTAIDTVIQGLAVSVSINVAKGGGSAIPTAPPSTTPTATPTRTPTRTPTPIR